MKNYKFWFGLMEEMGRLGIYLMVSIIFIITMMANNVILNRWLVGTALFLGLLWVKVPLWKAVFKEEK